MENNNEDKEYYDSRYRKPFPQRYEGANFSEFSDTAIAKLKAALKNNRGAYIWGGVGTGKTRLLYGIINRIHEMNLNRLAEFKKEDKNREITIGFPVPRIYNVTQLLHDLRDDFDRNPQHKEVHIGDIQNTSFLILDDIGAEKMTDWVGETFYLILNHRYNEMLKTVFTSNLPLKELAERVGDRIASRIVEMCDIIELDGKDRRLK